MTAVNSAEDKVFTAWRHQQWAAASALCAESELVSINGVGGSPPWRIIAEFRCRGLVQEQGRIVKASLFYVGITFPPDYLCRAYDSLQILTLLGPANIFHPNAGPGRICVGKMPAGHGLVDILYQVFEVLSFQKYLSVERDALNPAACQWVRRNVDRLPIDARPLKQRRGPHNGPAEPRP